MQLTGSENLLFPKKTSNHENPPHRYPIRFAERLGI